MADGGGRTPRIESATGLHRDRPNDVVTYRAKTFIVASGYTWSSHLLLLSASSRFPNGVANSSGLVGKYMNGHGFIQSHIELDAEIYPGMNEQHSLISRQFFRAPKSGPFVRHDLRLWESPVNRDARLRDDAGTVLLGDAVMADWRARTRRATARVRAYYDVHPDRTSELTLDPATKNQYGDALPKIVHRPDAASQARWESTQAHIRGVFERLAKADNGRLHPLDIGTYWDHPAGGCRMGTDPAVERHRQLRPHARSREPVRRRRADAADRRLHQRHADLCRGDSAVRGSHRRCAGRRSHGGSTMTRSPTVRSRGAPRQRVRRRRLRTGRPGPGAGGPAGGRAAQPAARRHQDRWNSSRARCSTSAPGAG